MGAHHLRTTVTAAALCTLALVSQARAEGDAEARRVPNVFDASASTGSIATNPVAAANPAEVKSAKPVAPKALGIPADGRVVGADFERAAAVRPLIARYASEHGVPYALADAVVRLESRYDSGARSGPHVGLTQINARTAQSLGYQGSAAGLLDADTNLRFGIKYLAQAYRLAGGDTCGTILRYQAGHRAQAMTVAARAYCSKIQAILTKTP